MRDGWSYRKIACPPKPTDAGEGRWVLVNHDSGVMRECTDITPLLRYLVDDVVDGGLCMLRFVKW